MRKPKKIKKVETLLQWNRRKASQFRASWVARAKKLGVDVALVPSRESVLEWLSAIDIPVCYYSKTPISRDVVEADHLEPISRKGSFSLSNVVLTSRFYNQVKGDLNDKEFFQLLNTVSDWEDKGKSLMIRLISSNRRFGRTK
jgi:hypothetical protein